MAFDKDGAIQSGSQGAAIGTAFGGPGLGTAIGGGLGALYGGFFGGGGPSRLEEANRMYGKGGARGDVEVPGYDQLAQQYGGYLDQRGALADQYGNRAPEWSNQRGNQIGLGNILRQEAMGKGVGQKLVGMQAQDAANRASAQQFAALGGARPGMQAMAARNAMLGTALAQSGVGQQAALGSAQMTLGAQGQYGQHLAGVRGQDESTALNSRQLNDNAQLRALDQQMGLMDQRRALAGMQQQGAQWWQGNQTDRWKGAMGQPTSGEVSMGALTGLGGALMNYKKPA